MEINIDRNFKQSEEMALYKQKAVEFVGKALDAKDYMILAAYKSEEGLTVLHINAINPGPAFEAIATMIYRTCDSTIEGEKPSKKVFRRRVRTAMWTIWRSIKRSQREWKVESAKNEFKQ